MRYISLAEIYDAIHETDTFLEAAIKLKVKTTRTIELYLIRLGIRIYTPLRIDDYQLLWRKFNYTYLKTNSREIFSEIDQYLWEKKFDVSRYYSLLNVERNFPGITDATIRIAKSVKAATLYLGASVELAGELELYTQIGFYPYKEFLENNEGKDVVPFDEKKILKLPPPRGWNNLSFADFFLAICETDTLRAAAAMLHCSEKIFPVYLIRIGFIFLERLKSNDYQFIWKKFNYNYLKNNSNEDFSDIDQHLLEERLDVSKASNWDNLESEFPGIIVAAINKANQPHQAVEYLGCSHSSFSFEFESRFKMSFQAYKESLNSEEEPPLAGNNKRTHDQLDIKPSKRDSNVKKVKFNHHLTFFEQASTPPSENNLTVNPQRKLTLYDAVKEVHPRQEFYVPDSSGWTIFDL